ncbi:VOC family protein [Mesorhizobium sp. KR9-304]|uniref:VOC family protein n=1 Tax=Mesorhizobium sp. KR9-304 TaxID=3156614 RepID=UPI0032B4743A
MASGFFWYELMTTDVAGAEAFYKNVVGWTSEPFAGMDYTIFSAGERAVAGLMLLPEEAKAMGTPPCWMGYIHARDVDAATAGVKKAGGAVYREPADIPDVGRFSVVADPQGAAFMLMSPMGPDQPPVPRMTPGHVGWHELYAGDYKSAFDFYAGQYGWTKVREFDMGEMGIYLIFASDGEEGIGGIMTKPPQVPAPAWQFYFNVTNIQAGAKRITDNGGKITFGPMEVPDGSWVVNAQDPQGAHFALLAAKP